MWRRVAILLVSTGICTSGCGPGKNSVLAQLERGSTAFETSNATSDGGVVESLASRGVAVVPEVCDAIIDSKEAGVRWLGLEVLMSIPIEQYNDDELRAAQSACLVAVQDTRLDVVTSSFRAVAHFNPDGAERVFLGFFADPAAKIGWRRTAMKHYGKVGSVAGLHAVFLAVRDERDEALLSSLLDAVREIASSASDSDLAGQEWSYPIHLSQSQLAALRSTLRDTNDVAWMG